MTEPSNVPEATVKILVLSGPEGPSLYVNDYRVAGNKPWGGGREMASFVVPTEMFLRDLRAALPHEDTP